jgi:hypothetical protein
MVMARAVQARSIEVVVRCARCGYACPADAWRRLPKERTLTGADLTGCVSGWPADAVVEVRACEGCGSAMARRAYRAGA